MTASVLIVGAGPGGCSAAIALARAGCRVLLVDRRDRGRDKVCGDALIPDALAALETLGCLGAVLAQAHPVQTLRICAPDGTGVAIPGRLACLPRTRLDSVLLTQAQAAGADFAGNLSFTGVLEQGGRVCGARFSRASGAPIELRADHVLLATGAAAAPLQAAGMCLRRSPSGIALRAYFELPASLAQELDAFTISFDRRICPGYGWLFAGPERVFNVGVGFFHDALRRPASTSLHELWRWFQASFEPAARIARFARPIGPLRGAPLRTSLRGACAARPGLLLVGETLGSTYAFSGEGIGKAMETGLLAAQCLAQDPTHAEANYEALLRSRLKPRHDAYRTAQHWLSFPAACNLLARRANRGTYIHAQLESMLAETGDPRALFSPAGLVRGMLS
jgi:flavin-dependent dehydrogenase